MSFLSYSSGGSLQFESNFSLSDWSTLASAIRLQQLESTPVLIFLTKQQVDVEMIGSMRLYNCCIHFREKLVSNLLTRTLK